MRTIVNRRKFFLIAVASLATVTIAGCKTDLGQEYLGHWRSVDSNVEIKIERNGDSFSMTVDPRISIASKGDSIRRIPAVLTKEGSIEFDEGMGSRFVSIDKKSGRLLAFDQEFVKISQ